MASMTFRYQGASAKLECVDENNRLWIIRNLWSRLPRQGHAGEVLKMIVNHADRYGWTLEVVAQQYGRADSRAMSNKQLVEFYESFGFEPQRTKPPVRLLRVPK